MSPSLPYYDRLHGPGLTGGLDVLKSKSFAAVNAGGRIINIKIARRHSRPWEPSSDWMSDGNGRTGANTHEQVAKGAVTKSDRMAWHDFDVNCRNDRDPVLGAGPGLAPSDVAEAVAAGQADFGVCTSSVLLDRARGRNLVVLGVIFQHSAAIILVPRRTGSHGVRTQGSPPDGCAGKR